MATGRTCINGLTDVPNLDTGQVQFPQQEHLLLYRITVCGWLWAGVFVVKRLLEEGARENLEFMLERSVWGKGGK